ncbi:MAG TPA: 1,4-alpha-glucan branching enzyme, partial [Actinomycetota bacterium]|nr:1,4-alpha-glucan branching enzyme [Actinomycetota bacterium]
MTTASIGKSDIARLVRGEHHEPHRVLGPHPQDGQVVIRAWRPDATAVTALVGAERVELDQVHPAGLFEGAVERSRVPAYQLEVSYQSGTYTLDDPYRFLPTIGELDLHLVGEGRHEELYETLGAHVRTIDGVTGTSFAVWA